LNGNRSTIVTVASLAAAAVVALVSFFVLGRYSKSTIFANSTWADGNWNPVTHYSIGDEKYLVTRIPSWFSPKTIQTVHVESGVSTPGIAHDWQASTGTTYRTDGGVADVATSFSDYAIVTGSVKGIPCTFYSNSAPITVS